MKKFPHFRRYLAKFFLEWEIFYIQVAEKIKTHILCSISFLRKLHLYEITSKNMVETEKPEMTSQYDAYSLHAGLGRLHARMRKHTPARSGTHMHARTHARARLHTPISNTYCFSKARTIRKRISMLRYMYTAPLVSCTSRPHIRNIFKKTFQNATCMSACTSKRFNQLIALHEISYKHFSTSGHPNTVLFNTPTFQ